jgi:cell division protein FtsN
MPDHKEPHSAVELEPRDQHEGTQNHEIAAESPANHGKALGYNQKNVSDARSMSLAEDHADAVFNQEANKEKLGVSKVVPMSLPMEKKSEAQSGVRYTLQVGSHRTVAEASEQVSALKHEGLDAFYLEARVPGKGKWYRVGVGVFRNREDAERAADSWKSKGLPSHIVQKIGE